MRGNDLPPDSLETGSGRRWLRGYPGTRLTIRAVTGIRRYMPRLATRYVCAACMVSGRTLSWVYPRFVVRVLCCEYRDRQAERQLIHTDLCKIVSGDYMALSISLTANPANAEEPDRKVTLTLPTALVRELKRRMAAEDTTMRALVLEALAEAGYDVAVDELRDRRRRR